MFKVIKIKGQSLAPEYLEGDFVILLTSRFFLNMIHVGDIVVFDQLDYGRLIKKVAEISHGGDQFTVTGTHQHSIDSATFGPITRDDVIGKLLWHIPKPRT